MSLDQNYDTVCDKCHQVKTGPIVSIDPDTDICMDCLVADYVKTTADVERLTAFSAPMAATLATLRELTASDDVVETVRELYGEVERLAAELAAARERERWIPCAERMPDAQRRVMICFMGQVSIAKYIPIVDQWSLDEGLYIHVDNRVWVDAWRELPAAPVQEVEP